MATSMHTDYANSSYTVHFTAQFVVDYLFFLAQWLFRLSSFSSFSFATSGRVSWFLSVFERIFK